MPDHREFHLVVVRRNGRLTARIEFFPNPGEKDLEPKTYQEVARFVLPEGYETFSLDDLAIASTKGAFKRWEAPPSKPEDKPRPHPDIIAMRDRAAARARAAQ